jgi:PHS family inorganic phosphate transporter-like MFS transporter
VVHHTERSPITFSVAAGYNSVAHFMDRIGHRRLQIIGFFGMGAGIGLIGVIPGLTAMIVPFLALSGIGFFFALVAVFGPTTTFALASECCPISTRTTGHGISAQVAKGAFPETTERSFDDISEEQRVVVEAERIVRTSEAAASYSRT